MRKSINNAEFFISSFDVKGNLYRFMLPLCKCLPGIAIKINWFLGWKRKYTWPYYYACVCVFVCESIFLIQ